jgi:hypothetical protein
MEDEHQAVGLDLGGNGGTGQRQTTGLPKLERLQF